MFYRFSRFTAVHSANYRADIQGLRALAVLMVFIFHLNSAYLPGGFIGVDIFFVISGYLISGIILRKKEQGNFRLTDFYMSRFKRIVPAYYFFLTVVLLAGIWIYLPMEIHELRKTGFFAAAFLSNVHLAALDNYFGAQSSENPLLHTWTLAVEMQVYFILPFLLVFLKKKFLKYVLTALIAVLFVYSFIRSTFLFEKDAAYFSLLARMPEFLIGTLAAVIEQNRTEQNRICRVGGIGSNYCLRHFLFGKNQFSGLMGGFALCSGGMDYLGTYRAGQSIIIPPFFGAYR